MHDWKTSDARWLFSDALFPHQLATQINWHRRALGPGVERNPALLNKVHIQFHQFWKSRGEIGVGPLIALFRTYRLFPSRGCTLVILQLPHFWKTELSGSRDHDDDFPLYSLSSSHRQYRVAFGVRRWRDSSRTIHICSHNSQIHHRSWCPQLSTTTKGRPLFTGEPKPDRTGNPDPCH